MKNEKTKILVNITIFFGLIPHWRAYVSSCTKRSTHVEIDATTTRPELDEDYYKCEGKKISKTQRDLCLYNEDTQNSGDHGSVNMTAAMLGQMSLSVRPPCVISLKLEQIGEVSQKNKCLIKGSLPLAVYSLRVNTDSPATDQR